MRSRWHLLVPIALTPAVAALALWAWSSRRGRDPMDSRPNVVLISLDTARPDHLGCYGYPKATSPNLDLLAARGVRFTRARTQAPWTLPSHMALFTSLLPSRCGLESLNAVLPPEIPTLARILAEHGYNTAGLVNDGQMKAQWGFNRGFRLWHEFPLETPAGDCVHLTGEALRWLKSAPAEPFFLFLHYYDAHDPYNPPALYRERFNSFLTARGAGRVLRQFHRPIDLVGDPKLFAQAIGSYDGAISWLDAELGPLLTRLPVNTIVVVFSDHGEAFKEHGWTLHGATLYEEETRVALIVSGPGVPLGRTMDEPVMLLDVAPTILALCGIAAPPHYEGTALDSLWQGKAFPDRPVLSSTKAPYDKRAAKAVVLGEWKLIRSLLDGREEFYRLPDEKSDRISQDEPMRAVLSRIVCRWIGEDDFWVVHAHGQGEFEATLVPQAGQIVNVIPFGDDPERDSHEYDPNGRWFRWKCRPLGKTKSLYFELLPPAGTSVSLDLRIDGAAVPDRVNIGTRGRHPAGNPTELSLDDATADPVIAGPFRPEGDGFFVVRHRGHGASAAQGRAGITLDEQTIRQLRSLGYLR